MSPKVKVFDEMEKEETQAQIEIVKEPNTPTNPEAMGKRVKCRIFRLDGRTDEISVTINGVPFKCMPGIITEAYEAHIAELEKPYDAWESYEDETGRLKMRQIPKFRFTVRREQ